MFFCYRILSAFAYTLLKGVALFSPKLLAFVKGRSHTFSTLTKKLNPSKPTVWFHCASLGEFEQGLPVMRAFLKQNSHYQLVVSFFSPSGYNVRKDTDIATAVVYLPWDSLTRAKRFIQLVKPDFAFFIKYEIWPAYLQVLKEKRIPTFLISALFRANQIYFKWYGGFMRKWLFCFEHIFLQTHAAGQQLETVYTKPYTISGDTRFDRVSQQLLTDNALPFLEAFTKNKITLVCGSTWDEDLQLIKPFISEMPEQCCLILAPHKIDIPKIDAFIENLNLPAIRYSLCNATKNMASYKIVILDSVGMLSKTYSYADIAYVGGGMGTSGLHNILEPATFGVPVIIGKNYTNFPEAIKLRQLAGLYAVATSEEFTECVLRFINDQNFRTQTGKICAHFVHTRTGATQKIMNYLEAHYAHGLPS